MSVVIDGPFHADEQRLSGIRPLVLTSLGTVSLVDWRRDWVSQDSFVQLVNRDGEFLTLGEVEGLTVYCASHGCAQRALRHRRPPPMVAKVILGPPLVVVTLLGHLSQQRRDSGYRIAPTPTELRCWRCGATGRALDAEVEALRVEPVE